MPLLSDHAAEPSIAHSAARAQAEQLIAWANGSDGQEVLNRVDQLGWTSGGCGLLALACKQALRASMWGLWGERNEAESGACKDGSRREDSTLQHVIVELNGIFFDGEQVLGTSVEEAAMNYGMFEDLLITDWDSVLVDDIADAHIYCDRYAVRHLATQIDRRSPGKSSAENVQSPVASAGYLGDCRTIIEHGVLFSDATEMAGVIENSTPLSLNEFRSAGCALHGGVSEFGRYQGIAWSYNPDADIHHFFRTAREG